MDEAQALNVFATGDATAAGQAFGRLCTATRPYLHACLRLRLPEPQDREDVLQRTYLRVWEARQAFHDMGVAAWRGYLKRVAFRCCADLAGDATITVSDEELERYGIADAEAPFIDALVEAVALDRVLLAADELWLGVSPDLSAERRTRRLLAAQLFYLDRAPWETVLRVLGTADAGGPLTRDVLDLWLADPAHLRLLAYQELYYDGQCLAGHLLGNDPKGAWTDAEVAVIGWRYRSALLLEQILARQDCGMTREEVVCVLDRCAARFPFDSRMRDLRSSLGRAPGTLAHEALATPGLWHRLVFQYGCMDDLPQRDVLDRVESPARTAGYVITAGMLNVWLSNRRLLKRLAEYCLSTLGDEGNDGYARSR